MIQATVAVPAALLLLVLAACDLTPSPPTGAEARRMIEFAFRTGAGPLVRVDSFLSIGERRGTALGAPFYVLTWHAKFEFSDHALWCYPFTVLPYDVKKLALARGAKEVQRYDSGFVDGSITFIYNAANGYHVVKGWQLHETNYSDTNRGCR